MYVNLGNYRVNNQQGIHSTIVKCVNVIIFFIWFSVQNRLFTDCNVINWILYFVSSFSIENIANEHRDKY